MSGPGCLVPAKGMKRQVEALPQAERGELRYWRWRQTYTAHRYIPSALYNGAMNVLRGGPENILVLGPYCSRVTQRRHRTIPEPAQPIGHGYADGVWSGGTPPTLLTVLAVPPHEYMFAGATRQIFEGNM